MKHLPWSIQPRQANHGEHTVICDNRATVLAIIPSAAWDEKAVIPFPEDRLNARLFRAAPELLTELKDALAIVEGLLTDSQLDFPQPDGRTARGRIASYRATIAEAEGTT